MSGMELGALKFVEVFEDFFHNGIGSGTDGKGD